MMEDEEYIPDMEDTKQNDDDLNEEEYVPDTAIGYSNAHDGYQDNEDLEPAPIKKKKAMRKNPKAPKRFKSPYICFFVAKQEEIKNEIGHDAPLSSISKRSAQMWKSITPEERAHWDEIALKDKERFNAEKATYTGAWHVPWKRAKKDPSAPKRPMSAFLYYSQEKRKAIKLSNPGIQNTEVSRILGKMWREASTVERKPHIEKERSERDKYKVAIAAWREENDKKVEAEKKEKAEQLDFFLRSKKENGEDPYQPTELPTTVPEPVSHHHYDYGHYPPYYAHHHPYYGHHYEEYPSYAYEHPYFYHHHHHPLPPPLPAPHQARSEQRAPDEDNYIFGDDKEHSQIWKA